VNKSNEIIIMLTTDHKVHNSQRGREYKGITVRQRQIVKQLVANKLRKKELAVCLQKMKQ